MVRIETWRYPHTLTIDGPDDISGLVSVYDRKTGAYLGYVRAEELADFLFPSATDVAE